MQDNELKPYRAISKNYDSSRSDPENYDFLDFWYAGNPIDLIGYTMPCTKDNDKRLITNDTFIVWGVIPLAQSGESVISKNDNVIGNFKITKED